VVSGGRAFPVSVGALAALVLSIAASASGQTPHEACRLAAWQEVLPPRPPWSGLSVIIGPFEDFEHGLRTSTVHSILGGPDPATTGLFFGQGAGLGSLVGAVTSAGVSLVGTPLTVVGDVLWIVPALGDPLSRPFYQLSARLERYAGGAATRADVFRRRRQGRLFSIPANDVSSTFRGVLSNVTGITGGTTRALGGLFSLTGQYLLEGVADLGLALVPRYGRFAGPGHGDSSPTAPPPLFNANDLFSRCHDIGYGTASLSTQPKLDRVLIGDLLRSAIDGGQPGPVGQVYRVLEMTVFVIKAPVQAGVLRLIGRGSP
jgi:hypothetical protein